MLIDLILHPLISVYIHINLDYVRLIGVLGMYVVDSSDRFHFSKYFIVNGVIQLAGNRFSIFVTIITIVTALQSTLKLLHWQRTFYLQDSS